MSGAERRSDGGTLSGPERHSDGGTLSGVWQFITCASATAAMRFPTPSGPAKIRLGGKVPRVAARAIKSSK
jgi:hypothetical protein